MSTDLVPVDNMAAVEALPAEARELAVTQMLSEARSWLAHAVEASGPQSIANFKAQMATVAEATKQLGLSKGIQMDAQEMVRRAERGVGLAIRKGQAEGTVARRGQGAGGRPPNAHRDRSDTGISLPTDFAPDHELSSNDAGIYHLTDGVSDERFEEALTDAKAEENLSRANVVRKVRGQASPLSGEKRLARIRELSVMGWTSGQIAEELGHVEDYIRKLARQEGITINADETMRGLHRGINHTQIVDNTVSALDALASGIQILNLSEVSFDHSDHWVASLTDSLRALNRFKQQIREASTA